MQPSARVRGLRSGLLVIALLGSTAVLGCGRVAPESGARPAPASSPEVRASADPVSAWTDSCTRQVGYWVVRLLDEPDHSYDYQEMGLSGRTYEALREVMGDAGARPRSPMWVERRSAEVCASHARRQTAEPAAGNGWP